MGVGLEGKDNGGWAGGFGVEKDDGGWAGGCFMIRFVVCIPAAGASMVYQLTGNEKNSLQLKI